MTTTIYFTHIDSPLGPIFVQGDGHFVTGLFMPGYKGSRSPDVSRQQSDAPFTEVRRQLAEYFSGERQHFDVPLKLAGTPFQQRVWQELVRIPFGTTITYAELARRIGKPTASRAMGHANARNPISILVPCHRVIGADGRLTGYAGGVEKKQWLLDWERRTAAAEPGHSPGDAGISPVESASPPRSDRDTAGRRQERKSTSRLTALTLRLPPT